MDGGHFLAQLSCRSAWLQDDACRCGEQGRRQSVLGPQSWPQWTGGAAEGAPSLSHIRAPLGCGLADPADKPISTVCPQCVTAVLSRPGCCLRWSRAGPGEAGVPRPPAHSRGEGWAGGSSGCSAGWLITRRGLGPGVLSIWGEMGPWRGRRGPALVGPVGLAGWGWRSGSLGPGSGGLFLSVCPEGPPAPSPLNNPALNLAQDTLPTPSPCQMPPP